MTKYDPLIGSLRRMIYNCVLLQKKKYFPKYDLYVNCKQILIDWKLID